MWDRNSKALCSKLCLEQGDVLGEEKDFRLVPNIHSNNWFLKIAVSEQLPSCALKQLREVTGLLPHR